MERRRDNIYSKIKIRVIFLLILMAMTIVGIIVTSMGMASTLKTSSSVVNIFGRQRMYTQSIAKNASRTYVLFSAIESDDRVQDVDLLTSKLKDTQAKLLVDREAFENVLMELANGYVVVGEEQIYIDEDILIGFESDVQMLLELWGSYSDAAVVIANSESIDVNFRNALININEGNEELLYYAQDLTNSFDAAIIDQYYRLRNISYGFIGILVILAITLVYLLYSYLFSSLEVFYDEIEKIGIDHEHGKALPSNRTLTTEIKRLLIGFTETLELIERINSSGSFSETLNYIYESFSHYLPYTYIGIALLKEDEPKHLVASYGIGDEYHPGLAKELLNHDVLLHKTSLDNIMQTLKPRVINDLDEYFKTHEMQEYSRIIMKHGIKSSITVPLQANGIPLGFIFFSSNQKNVYKSRHIEYLKLIGNSIALSFEKNIFSEELVYSSVLALAKLSEARDEDTGAHLTRMSHYAGVLAKALSKTNRYKDIINQEYIDQIIKFSPMHDIGKVGVPDKVLLKPGKLTHDEFEVMKTHTLYGANVLGEAEKNLKRSGRSLFKMGISIALNHHEKFDGSGYPNGKVGEEIPLEARIVAVADVFDALRSRRPYKEPFTLEDTLKILNEGKGKHFDPFIVDIFIENLDEMLEVEYLYEM